MDPEIKFLVLDIDGVLTDGTIGIDGLNSRRLYLRDLDALTRAREAGIEVSFLTGESKPEVEAVVKRCGGGKAVYNAKDKAQGIKELAAELRTNLSNICYIGDARRDIPALQLVGLGLTPADGDSLTKASAHQVLRASGGRGAVAEAVYLLLNPDNNDLIQQR